MSGIIASAISETSLDLTGLERGIEAATARLRAAVDEWSRIAVVNVQVDIDTAEAETKFEAFMARIRGRSVDVDVDIDRDRVAEAVNDIDNAVDDVNDTRVNWRDIFDGLPEVGGNIGRWLTFTTGEIRDEFDGIDVRPDFDFDVDEFQAGLRDLLGDLRLFQDEASDGISVPVEPEVDRNRFRSMFDGLQGDVRSLAERLTERFNATFRGLGADADLDPARRAVQGLGDDFDDTFETAESGLSRLSSRLSQIGNRLRGSTATFTVDSDGVAEAVVQAETLTAAIRAVPNRVRTRYELDGLSGALAEALEIRTVIASIPNRVRTVVDVDTSFMDKLRGFFGGGSKAGGLGGLLAATEGALGGLADAAQGAVNGIGKGLEGLSSVGDSVAPALKQVESGVDNVSKSVDGLGGKFGNMASSLGVSFAKKAALMFVLVQALGPLVSSIAALIAWLIPLAAGAVAAAGGLLLLVAAATAATAAVGVLAVAFDPATLELLKGQIQQLKNALNTLLATSLAPVKSLIVDQFIPALFQQLGGVIAALAPSVTATLEPIMDAILAIVPILESVGPVAVATGQGIGRLLTTFGKFAAAVDIGAVVEQVNALFGALDGTLELLGQSGLAFLPILTKILELFEGLARQSIGPFTEIIATFGAALPDFADSLNNILEPLGRLAVIGGQGFAALAGSFDELWGIVQAVIPGLNFDVIGVAWQRILPTMAQTLERLSPVIERIGEAWVAFTEELFNSQNMVAAASGFESLASAFLGLVEALPAASRWLMSVLSTIADFAGPLLSAAVGFVREFIAAMDWSGLAAGLAPIWSILVALADVLAVIAPVAGSALGGLLGSAQLLLPVLGAIVALRLASVFGGWASAFGEFAHRVASSIATLNFSNLQAGISSLASSIGAANLAVGGIGAAVGAGLYIYSQWAAKNKEAADATKDLTQALLDQKNVLGTTLQALQDRVSDLDISDEVNASGVSLFRLSEELRAVPGNFDKLRDALGSDITSGLDRIAGRGIDSDVFTESMENLEAKAKKAGATIGPEVRRIFESLAEGKLDVSSARDLINALDDMDEASKGASSDITQQFRAISDAADGLNVNLGTSLTAFEGLSFTDQKAEIDRILQQYPKIAEAVGVASSATGGYQGVIDGTTKSLEEYSETVNTSIGELELVGPAARKAAAGLAVVRKQFANTIPAVAALGEELRKPSDLLAAGVDRAKAKLGEQEKTVKDSVSSMAGVSLSGVFAIDDDDVSNVRDKAKEVSDAVQEFLGRGRLAEFVEGSERSVSQALDKLARSLQQKVVNIQRLKLVDSLGFSDLAAQLASLDADPAVLGKYLDQLFGAGTATMAQENARLAQLRGALTAGYAGLSPALSAALGEDFGQEANDKIKDTTDNINVALDKLVNDVRLKAENMRRVAALDAAGFGALAESLATLNADPKALKSALDQLAAGGTAAYRSANGKLQSAGDALVAQQATLGPRLKEAFGVSGDEAAEGVEKSKVTIGLALENMREVVAEKMQAVANLKDLEAKGFNDIASYLAGLDPEQINQFYNELAAGAEGGFAVVEAQLEQQTTDWKNQLVGLDPEIAAGLVASGVLTVAEIEAMGIRITNAIDEFLALPPPSEWALFGGPGVGASQAETLAGEIVAGLDKGFAQVEQSAQTRGEAVGALFTEGIRAAVIGAEVDTTAGLTESVDRIFAGLATAVQIQGETAGKAFTGGLSAGITGGEVDTTVAIGDAVERIFQGLEMGKGFTTPGTMGGTIGDLFGSRIVAAVVWAEATTAAGITGAVERIFAALQTGTAFLVAGEVGKGVGVTFNDGAVEGFRTSATRVTDSARALVVVVGTTASLAALDAGRTAGETFGAWFSFGFAVSAPDITATATGVFDALVAATSTQLVTAGTDAGARFAASISIGFTNGAFGVAVAISTLIDSTIRGVVATAVKKFTDAGVFLGLAMGAGISDGLAFSLALVKLQAIALATAIQVAIQQALGINSPSRVGMEIGAYFGEGMALGLAQSSSLVAAQANAMAVAASDAVAQSFKTTAGDVVTAVTEAAGTIKAGSGRDALGKYFNILTPDGWVKRYYERTAAELDGVITAATSTAPPVAIAPDFDVSALQALALPPLSVQVIPVVDAGFLAAMRTATDSVSGFPAPIPAAAAGLPQQAAIAATAGTTDQTMLVVLQQILTAIQGIDATTDPLVLLMLQQILGNLEAPLTPEQQREQAAFVKTLVGR